MARVFLYALLLAAVGTYAVLAFLVGQRSSEIAQSHTFLFSVRYFEILIACTPKSHAGGF